MPSGTTSHSADMDTTKLGWPMRWWVRATWSRLDSIKAAPTKPNIVMMWPIPIRWRGVNVRRARFRHVGRRKRSTIRIEMTVAKKLKSRNVPAGILKWGPRYRSMVSAWRVTRLEKLPIEIPKKIPVDHNGIIRIRVLRSSTSSTVHSFHDLAYKPFNCLSPSVLSAARFKNLQKNEWRTLTT